MQRFNIVNEIRKRYQSLSIKAYMQIKYRFKKRITSVVLFLCRNDEKKEG
jgi:hypothetical protein